MERGGKTEKKEVVREGNLWEGKKPWRTKMQEKQKPQKLNAEQVSLILNISVQTVKKLAKEKELPCEIINRRPFFNWNVLIEHFHELEGGAA